MKTKIIIVAAAVLLIGLFVPVPKTYADGTKSYNAVAYKIVKWNRPFYKNLMFTEKEVYKFPHSLNSVEKIWAGMAIDPAVSTLTGTVEHFEDGRVLVRSLSDDAEVFEAGMTVDITDYIQEEYAEGETVAVEYVPSAYSKGPKVEKIVDVQRVKNENPGEKETTLMFEDSAVFIKSTRECEKYIIPEKVQLSYDKDAGVVNEIFGRYQFKTDPYDNLPDYEITLGASKCYYESSSGIVTDSTVKKVNEEQSFVLSEADRETINNLIKKYYESSTTIKSTSPVPDTHKSDPDDSIHYVRLSWNSSADYPQVVFIRNRAQYQSLFADMNAESYDSNTVKENFDKKYTDRFFQEHALVVVFTSESTGSNYYTGVSINSDKNEIVINRYHPEVYTCDMASWAVICEISSSDPILKQDNTKTEVIFTE